ncbi:PDZ domain containing protein [Nitzschia inconspicua]|uniref:PDZ domain containing protein n=1 Tax=Nitzschia inconspicua TaxID=303405 RepID=A0A9K3KJU8_9STRA|nr:PDZ domain containing protein [Nitzschia inconspicua]
MSTTSKDPLSLSRHRSSHHSRGEFVSISVIKEDPNEKAGIRLEQDSTGRLKVRNIARNGLFGESGLEIGDIVLSINRVRLSDGEPPEALVEVANKATRNITIVVKKPSQPQTAPNEKMAKKLQKKKDVAEALVTDNNCTKQDTYYNGLAQRNEDGSLNCKKEVQEERAKRGPKMTVTISAMKEDRDDIIGIEFVVQHKKLWVAHLDPDNCIFSGTDLAIGDCILSINDMSFREYVDAEYAETICAKARAQVTLVVVKNEEGFTPSTTPRPVKKVSANRPPKRNSSSSSIPSKDRKKQDNVPKQRSSSNSSRSSRRSNNSKNEDDDNDQVGPLRSLKGNKAKTLSTASSRKAFGNIHRNLQKNIAVLNGDEDETAPLSSDDSSTSSGNNNSLPPSQKSDFKIEKYTQANISAPKSYWKEAVGVEFRTDTKLQMIYVHKILDGSIFERTSLEEGDYVLTINDVSFQGGADCADRRKAAKICMQAKESVNMVVLKDESTYLETAFNLDSSVSNLNWMVESVRGGILTSTPRSP